MRGKQMKRLLGIGGLILVTGAAMAYARQTGDTPGGAVPTLTGKSGVLSVSARLTQERVLHGGDGVVGLALTLDGEDVRGPETEDPRATDMVIVLDRSGSMSGEKIAFARQAIHDLLGLLTAKDRFALVTYSDDVRTEAPLAPVTAGMREHLQGVVNRVAAGGGTNLGGGLQVGMGLLGEAHRSGNLGRVILISDGLANQGVTDPVALGTMAAGAVRGEFSVSTVGVGQDFNEQLMTALADRGTGTYHYLENPTTFAAVIEEEFRSTRTVVATAVEVQVPLEGGVTLVSAGGYPVDLRNGSACFRPGDILAGQSRSIFLSLRVPTDQEKTFELEKVRVQYRHGDEMCSVALPRAFRIACVRERGAVLASIDRDVWEKKVIQEDFHALKEGGGRGNPERPARRGHETDSGLPEAAAGAQRRTAVPRGGRKPDGRP